MHLILQEDLVDQYPQRAPAVPNMGNPDIGILMALTLEADAGGIFRNMRCCVPPTRRRARRPGLEVTVDFQRFVPDGLRICNLALSTGRSEVDHAE